MENEILKEQIKEVCENPKYKKNFQMYPYFSDIAYFLAIDYNISDMPKILETTYIKPFNRSAQTFGIIRETKGYSTGALGISCRAMEPKTNKPRKERIIHINQFFDDREKFDFEDFSVNTNDKYGQNFSKARKEEISFQNEDVETLLFDKQVTVVVEDDMPSEDMIKIRLFNPQVRPKRGYEHLFDGLEQENVVSKKQEEIDEQNEQEKRIKEFKSKETLTHEFLHGLAHRRGLYFGGIQFTTRMMLHEGMTEYLSIKTINNHKEFFGVGKNKRARPFEYYRPFVMYAKMMETIFPGSVEDAYFNGKQVIKKYATFEYSLQNLIDGFSAVEEFNNLSQSDKFEDKQYFAQEMIKSLLKQKQKTKVLLDNQKISKKQYGDFVDLMQEVYDSSLRNKKFSLDFSFKESDTAFSRNKLKKQRQEHYSLEKK